VTALAATLAQDLAARGASLPETRGQFGAVGAGRVTPSFTCVRCAREVAGPDRLCVACVIDEAHLADDILDLVRAARTRYSDGEGGSLSLDDITATVMLRDAAYRLAAIREADCAETEAVLNGLELTDESRSDLQYDLDALFTQAAA
jgi:hypothetical protein